MFTKTLLSLSIASSFLLPTLAHAKSKPSPKAAKAAKVEAAPQADDSLMWFELAEGEVQVSNAKPKAAKKAPKRGMHLEIHTAGFGDRAASTPTGACEGRCDKTKRKGFSMELLEQPAPQPKKAKSTRRTSKKRSGNKPVARK